MNPNEINGWIAIIERIGPQWSVLVLFAGLLIYQANKRAKSPSESEGMITRRDLDRIEKRLDEIEKIKGVVSHMAIDGAAVRALNERIHDLAVQIAEIRGEMKGENHR